MINRRKDKLLLKSKGCGFITNVLIVYGTWYGATSDTSEKIAEILRKRSMNVRLADLGKESVEDISEYDLVIVGSGVRMNRWNGDAEKFIDKNKGKLASKKVAIFVSAGGASIDAKRGDVEKKDDAYRRLLVEKAEKYSLDPISMGLFGGIFDYNKMNWLTRKLLGRIKKSLREFKIEEKDGVFDTRDREEIRRWAEKLADKVEI